MDALDSIFRRLVLAARAAGALERPIDVGELLQTLVPYPSARRDGTVETNEDYLHAVMRLIAGERDLVFTDDLLQDDLRAELASPNPDLTVLRTYTNAKLRVSTEGVQRVLAGNLDIDLRPPTPTPLATPRSLPTAARSEPLTGPRVHAGGPHAVGIPSTSEFDIRTPVTAAPGCPYCAQALPEGRAIKFCPSCGLNLLVSRCAGCSAEIDSAWKFCVTCGWKAS